MFPDRKSTRLNSSHLVISYAVFCLKKKKRNVSPTNHPRNRAQMCADRVSASLIIRIISLDFFFFNDTATTEIYTLSLHDALPIYGGGRRQHLSGCGRRGPEDGPRDRKSTRLNSSHLVISYAVFCLKKKNRCAWGGARLPAGRQARGAGACPARPLVLGRGRPRAGPPGTRSGGLPSPFFFFNKPAPTEIYPLSHHAAVPT